MSINVIPGRPGQFPTRPVVNANANVGGNVSTPLPGGGAATVGGGFGVGTNPASTAPATPNTLGGSQSFQATQQFVNSVDQNIASGTMGQVVAAGGGQQSATGQVGNIAKLGADQQQALVDNSQANLNQRLNELLMNHANNRANNALAGASSRANQNANLADSIQNLEADGLQKQASNAIGQGKGFQA